MYEDFKAKEPRFEALRSLFVAVLVSCAYRGFSRLALQVLDDLHLHEVHMKGQMHGDVYSLTMQACSKAQGFKEVIKVRQRKKLVSSFSNGSVAHPT